ncbi:MAG: class I SAM-dependent methyltransferase [Ignavibacteriales bacterium]
MTINNRWVQVTEADILEANINKYNDDNIINYYNAFEDTKYTYIEYDVIFKAVMEALSRSLGRSIKAVDMCGGAGKAAFTMKQCDPASEISLVDLSEKMLGIAHKRMIEEGAGEIRIVQADAFSFLETAEQYDMIVFSSAIHHFKDPIKLLATAAERLSPQGIILTIAEPTPIIQTKRFKLMTFLFGHKEYKYAVVKRWVKNALSPGDTAADDEFFDIAEYQAYKGIDDIALSSQLNSAGLYPLIHLRYPAGEPSMLKIMPYIGLNWSFSLILRKGQYPEDSRLSLELQDRIKEEMPFKINFL